MASGPPEGVCGWEVGGEWPTHAREALVQGVRVRLRTEVPRPVLGGVTGQSGSSEVDSRWRGVVNGWEASVVFSAMLLFIMLTDVSTVVGVWSLVI